MTSKNRRNLESGPAFKERRSFIGAISALGAGLAGSAILPATASAEARPESVCGRGYRRRHNRRENPWIRVERCIRFPRCPLRRVQRWRQALYAASQT
jgi:hypothetical protein